MNSIPSPVSNCGKIVALGTALPEQSIAQTDAYEMSCDLVCDDDRQRRLLRMLFRRSGVDARRTVIPWNADFWQRTGHDEARGPQTGARMAIYERYAPLLATESARCALGLDADRVSEVPVRPSILKEDPIDGRRGIESGACAATASPTSVDPESVTHLVTVSCTGFAAPGFDWHVVDALGLPRTVQRVQVGFMGCHGVINGMRVARGLAAADPGATVLVSAVELCSLHYRMTWDNEAMVGNALFADGSASAVVVGHERARDFHRGIPILDTASIRIPDSNEQMTWRIGDFGFDMVLTGEVPVSIENHLHAWLESWLGRHGLGVTDIADWIVHPGGPRILEATESALALGDGALCRSRRVLNEYGNMSSPTVLFVLRRSLESGVSGPRVMLAFGPGLVAEATLLGPE